MKKKVNKSKLNLIIDMVMLVILMAISGIGFMIKYVLVAGFERNYIYGKSVELYYAGLNRHQWGTIHLVLSFALLFLLLIHILYHWKQIVFIFKGMVRVRMWRIVLTSTLVMVSLVFGVLPLFLNPEVQDSLPHHLHQNHQSADQYAHHRSHNGEHNREHKGVADRNSNPIKSMPSKGSLHQKSFPLQNQDKDKPEQHFELKHKSHNNIEVYGFMTLEEVAKKYNIKVNDLALSIHIPKGHTNQKLGRLRKKYDFKLEDLRTYIQTKKDQRE